MSVVKNYLSLVKFSHTIFALPFALIGFALGVRYMGENHLAFEKIGLKFFGNFPEKFNGCKFSDCSQ